VPSCASSEDEDGWVVGQFEYLQRVEAVCKRDPLMLLGLGATFERSPGRRLGPHRLKKRSDAEGPDHSLHVVRQNVKAHLSSHLFEGLGEEVGASHP